ncbi:hypothetical protein [Marinomonas posidonica]|uniref:Uncharacterized protein n=1 Tax=Marinomonas posidonica (strain CECT 7376 / NCIMB 14433 / IVIA-Po-181) TaxID=491952 RepID=F6CUS3_MARPP|nr:hypothetical protein [Marinomonas posidonica]AEF54183.1 hypothetical protein Mar181_1135 [Marinomonas posidonica IVIA-Po-181]
MLPIWKGLGWLAPVIFVAAFVDVQMLIDGVMGEDFYQQNRWVKVFSLVAVALFVAAIGLWLNVRDRIWRVHSETGKKTRPPAHTFLFLPIEVWAVIVPCVFLANDYFQQEQESKTLGYIETPRVNDIYSVDFSKIFQNEDPIYKYGTMIVLTVEGNQIALKSSSHAYDGKRGVRKDLKNGTAAEASYYNNQVTQMTIRELLGYYKEGTLFAVHRE